jgi:hypothetical protein
MALIGLDVAEASAGMRRRRRSWMRGCATAWSIITDATGRSRICGWCRGRFNSLRPKVDHGCEHEIGAPGGTTRVERYARASIPSSVSARSSTRSVIRSRAPGDRPGPDQLAMRRNHALFGSGLSVTARRRGATELAT